LLKKYVDKTPSLHVARYWAMCEWFDETVGELLAKLEQTGQAANTIVIYLHDNGWIQDPDTPQYAPKSKQSPYDGGLRTPIIVRWPGQVKPGKSAALVSSIDLAPTILQAAKLKPTAEMNGLNLLDADALAKRDTLYGEIFLHTAVDLTQPKPNLRYRWVIEGTWKLILPDAVNSPKQAAELYDLDKDPHETRNLAAEQPDKLRSLIRKLDAWWNP
jgi:uncharacterized sulfatase